MIPAQNRREAAIAATSRAQCRRRWMVWSILAVVILLIAATAWTAVRAVAARDALEAATDGARDLQSRALAGDFEGLDGVAAAIAEDAATAVAQTSDPIWRASELVPWAGANLRAVRQVAEVVDDLAENGLSPLLAAAAAVDMDTLGVSGSHIDLAPLQTVQPGLADADAVFERARMHAAEIDAGSTLPEITAAVGELRATLDPAAAAVDGLARAAALLPRMLGAEGPRNYVLLMQNNAEVRASGGVTGAFALLHADQGEVTLTRQASTAEFRKSDDPVLPLSSAVIALFDELPGQYIQNAVMIPDFPTAAELAAAHWARNIGGEQVDGVLAVDTVTVSDILAATGTVEVGGYALTAENAADVLLSQVYRDITAPSEQDAVFEAAAVELFSAVTDGRASPASLISALGAAGEQGRLRLWSRHAEEQAMLAETTLAGALPADSGDVVNAGVFFNDTTGAKMNYYTDAEVTTDLVDCGDSSTLKVRVLWRSSAPADAASALPTYVTGGGHAGVPPGEIRTRIAVYGPEGWLPNRSSLDGGSAGAQSTIDGERPVIQYETILAPGASTEIVVDFTSTSETGAEAGAVATTVTPLLRPADVRMSVLPCAP